MNNTYATLYWCSTASARTRVRRSPPHAPAPRNTSPAAGGCREGSTPSPSRGRLPPSRSGETANNCGRTTAPLPDRVSPDTHSRARHNAIASRSPAWRRSCRSGNSGQIPPHHRDSALKTNARHLSQSVHGHLPTYSRSARTLRPLAPRSGRQHPQQSAISRPRQRSGTAVWETTPRSPGKVAGRASTFAPSYWCSIQRRRRRGEARLDTITCTYP